MAINSDRYVKIISRVGGLDAVAAKELLLRIYIDNDFLPPKSMREFDSSELGVIGRLFGTNSDAYKVAQFYFGFISKTATSPRKIQFARFNSKEAEAMWIGTKPVDISELASTDTQSKLTITIGSDSQQTGAIDLTGKTKVDEVCKTIETELKKISKPNLQNCTVKQNVTGGITLATSLKGSNKIVSITCDKEKFLEVIGWDLNSKPINSQANPAQTDIVLAIDEHTQNNNNYGSFIVLGKDKIKDIVSFAKWVSGRDIEFIYFAGVTEANAEKVSKAVSSYSSVGLTLVNDKDDLSYILPACILASQDFTQPAASQNYMFQKGKGLEASVFDDTAAKKYDKMRVNYYGRTQENGVMIDFYQRGVLQGGDDAPREMGVHASEQWFKSNVKSQFLSMFLAMPQVPASLVGQGIASSYIEDIIALAKLNGSITIGKVLTTTQRNYITQLTGNKDAYQSVQDDGCWYTTSLTVDKETGGDVLTYLLVYAKTNSISKIEGRHILI